MLYGEPCRRSRTADGIVPPELLHMDLDIRTSVVFDIAYVLLLTG